MLRNSLSYNSFGHVNTFVQYLDGLVVGKVCITLSIVDEHF